MPGGELTFNRATTVIVTWKKLSRRYELLSKALGVKLWFFADSATRTLSPNSSVTVREYAQRERAPAF